MHYGQADNVDKKTSGLFLSQIKETRKASKQDYIPEYFRKPNSFLKRFSVAECLYYTV